MMRSPSFSDVFALPTLLDQLSAHGLGGAPYRQGTGRAGENGASWAYPMPIDVYATNDQVRILAAVPGMTPDDLDLTIHQNTVTLSGTVHSVADSEDAKEATWYVSELGSGSYRRSVTLPFPVDPEHATATFEHGIVRIVLPKAESAKPRKIAITQETSDAVSATAAS
jgi:HSP20 family protein